jgi:hypothetical protein
VSISSVLLVKQTPSWYYHLHQRNTFGAFELKNWFDENTT